MDELNNKDELQKILGKLGEIKEQISQINLKSENNYKWLAKLARRILPISIAVTVIEFLVLAGVAGIVYFIIKFFVFSEAGRGIVKFVSSFSK